VHHADAGRTGNFATEPFLALTVVLVDDPPVCVVGELLKGARDAQIVRDVLTSRSAGENAVFNQTADLKFSDNQ
jgi:hypothetical protein